MPGEIREVILRTARDSHSDYRAVCGNASFELNIVRTTLHLLNTVDNQYVAPIHKDIKHAQISAIYACGVLKWRKGRGALVICESGVELWAPDGDDDRKLV